MNAIEISARSREDATREVLQRLGVPLDALDVEWSEEEEDLLAGARPFVKMVASVRPQYVAEQYRACLIALLDKMGIDAKVELAEECGIALVRVDTEDDELLIGWHGETLDAIQQIVLRITRLAGREIPLVLIDVGDYRAKRIRRLNRVARDLAGSVLESGKEEFFDPMDSIDRKIVHSLMKDIPGVTTYSRGEDQSRHVIVAPDDGGM